MDGGICLFRAAVTPDVKSVKVMKTDILATSRSMLRARYALRRRTS
jgi:hypothetical protein